MKEKIKKIEVMDVFLVFSLGISFLFIIGNALNGGQYFKKLVMDSTFLFSDFFIILQEAQIHPLCIRMETLIHFLRFAI